MRRLIFYLMAVCCIFVLASCVKGEKPQSFSPEVYADEAQEITRHSAVLSGGVTQQESLNVSECRFLFGTQENDLKETPTTFTSGKATAQLNDLTTGTDYFFCLEVGNGKQQVRSKVMSFHTLPDGQLVLSAVSVQGQTPSSLNVKCAVTNDDGGNIYSAGFAYKISGETTETEIAATVSDLNELTASISPLQTGATYLVRAFAVNSAGRSYSEEKNITIMDGVIYDTAGSLSTVIGSAKYKYTSISIQGPMNSTDFRTLRDMAGRNSSGEATDGKLKKIDLSAVNIVEEKGGVSYDGSRFTETDAVTSGMFANLPYLEEVVLPNSVTRVDEGAFANSTALTSITLPSALTTITASAGCTSLKEIQISSANENYSAVDGVLYNKAQTEIVWYPVGKEATQLVLPSTLTTIKKNTFRDCHINEIVLPATMTSIESYAFAGSEIASIVLPDNMTRLDQGVLAQCSNLKKVTLGTKMGYICEYSFQGVALDTLCVRASTPPVWQDEKTFGGMDATNCTVYVPKGKKTIYKSHTVWGKFPIKEMNE